MKEKYPKGQGSNGKVDKKMVSNKTIGPISNLEQHLQPDWWKRIFNSMYLKTDADVVEDNQITKKEVDLFQKILNIKEGETLLDFVSRQPKLDKS